MNELFENLSRLSIDELENCITRAKELIQEKQQEAQRLERERIEAERKKQEEISELKRRLKELQGDTESDVQPTVQENPLVICADARSEEQKNTYRMISCPHCHELIPSDSKFCFYCGGTTTQKKESQTDGGSPASDPGRPEPVFTRCSACSASIPSGSQFCQNCGKPVENTTQNT